MAHFAELDRDNVVLRVIVADQAFIDSGAVGEPSRWVQTSYNGRMRKNYAGPGYTYDKGRDAFIAPQPYASWRLDEATCLWEPPIPMPHDGKMYQWNEAKGAWTSVGDQP
jgi:hypothetical protein